jgi:hypothetical protein
MVVKNVMARGVFTRPNGTARRDHSVCRKPCIRAGFLAICKQKGRSHHVRYNVCAATLRDGSVTVMYYSIC